MNDSFALEAERNLTFQKIGQNMFELQRAEVLLKFLLSVRGIHAPMETIRTQIEARRKRIERMTLGQLRLEWRKFATKPEIQQRIASTDEGLAHFGVKLEGDTAFWEPWDTHLARVIDSRNLLVHGLLGGFKPNSIESCRATSANLDGQLSDLQPILDGLQSMTIQVRSMLAAYIEHEEREYPEA